MCYLKFKKELNKSHLQMSRTFLQLVKGKSKVSSKVRSFISKLKKVKNNIL